MGQQRGVGTLFALPSLSKTHVVHLSDVLQGGLSSGCFILALLRLLETCLRSPPHLQPKYWAAIPEGAGTWMDEFMPENSDQLE